MLTNMGNQSPPHPSTYSKGWTLSLLCLIIMAISIIAVIIIIIERG